MQLHEMHGAPPTAIQLIFESPEPMACATYHQVLPNHEP